jgi:aminoglycoside phosphotransferase (APT) family kinase protein
VRVRKAEITVEVVSCLIAEQFPQWADLEVRRVALDGWDNTTFRLGDEMSVRLPSDTGYVPQIDKERRWLPVLAPQLPVGIPRPIARGAPGCGFPRPWSIYGWLPGEPAAVVGVIDHDRLAEDLGVFLTSLQAVDDHGGPPPGPHSAGRGGPVSTWDEETRRMIGGLGGEIDVDGATEVWDAALAHESTGPRVWVHGDVTGSNVLLDGDRLCGVIDFGCSAVGDPACDLTPTWTMFEGSSRERFKALLPLDDGTWARGRGWALWKALIEIPGRSSDDPGRTGARFGWRWDARGVVDHVIADHRLSAAA